MTADEPQTFAQPATARLALIGLGFGACFAILGTFIECARVGQLTLTGALAVQANTPLLWMIDLIPFVLATVGSFVQTSARKYRTTGAQRRMPVLLIIQTVFSVLLFVTSLVQSNNSQSDIQTMNLSGSLRYRALYIHSTTFRADGSWRQVYAEMRTIFQTLRTQFPEETRPALKVWKIFSDSLDQHGYVDWFTANDMRNAANALTERLKNRLIEQTETSKRLLTFGSLSVLLSLVFSFSLLGQLRRVEDQLRENQAYLTRANQTLETKVHLDALTGLNNRRAFDDRLRLEFDRARSSGAALSVVMLDIDEFKKFNDAFGHPAGDDILRTIARVIFDVARSSDFPARYGGEEFIMILPRADTDGSCRAAERLRAAIEAQPSALRSITASLGVATLNDDMETPQDLIQAADRALYVSKACGRNRITHATSLKTTEVQGAPTVALEVKRA